MHNLPITTRLRDTDPENYCKNNLEFAAPAAEGDAATRALGAVRGWVAWAGRWWSRAGDCARRAMAWRQSGWGRGGKEDHGRGRGRRGGCEFDFRARRFAPRPAGLRARGGEPECIPALRGLRRAAGWPVAPLRLPRLLTRAESSRTEFYRVPARPIRLAGPPPRPGAQWAAV